MRRHKMKAALIAATVAAAGFAAVTPPAAAACASGYEAVRSQGKQVCRLKTPKLPLKSGQSPSRDKTYPKHLNAESWSWGGK
jgi:hypothetical protein